MTSAPRPGLILPSTRGQGALELVAVIPIMLLVFCIMVVLGRLIYIEIALDAAAHDGARVAVESLSQGRGPQQGYQAARWTLDGFNIKPDKAAVTLTTRQAWGRGTEVEVRVSYRPTMNDVLGVGWLFDYQAMTLTGRSVLQVEAYKSRWD